VLPNNYGFKKNESWTITLEFNESESGFNSSELLYRDNDNYVEGVGVVKGNLNPTSCDETHCHFDFNPNGNMDLVNNFNYFDSRFEISDKAGNLNDSFYHVFVDDEAPAIDLELPTNGTKDSSFTFTYNLTDNSFVTNNEGSFTPEVNCSLYFRNQTGDYYVDSEVSLDNETTPPESLTPNLDSLSDGTYDYYFVCLDKANWDTRSEVRTILLDRNGPIIVNQSHGDGAIVNNHTEIEFRITDDPSGVSHVWWSIGVTDNFLTGDNHVYTINSSYLTPNVNNNLEIHANDTAGNPSNSNFSIFVDVTAPTITLNSPVNNTPVKSNVIQFTADDDKSININCTVVDVNNGVDYVVSVVDENPTDVTLNSIVTDGDYPWRVECTDNVGNHQVSEQIILVYDTTIPEIELESPLSNLAYDVTNINFPDKLGNFSYNVTEIHLNTCNLYLNNVDWGISGTTDFINVDISPSCDGPCSSLTPSNDRYSWFVECLDNAGNSDNSTFGYFYYDTIDPSIDNVNSTNIADTSADIIWEAGEITKNTVFYGTNTTDTSDWENTSIIGTTENASVALSSLTALTTYYYYVESCDQFNQCEEDKNDPAAPPGDVSGEAAASSYYTFNTTATPVENDGGGSGGSGGGGNTCAKGYTREDGKCVKDEPVESSGACEEDWRCGSWSDCEDGIESRTCNDQYSCGTTDLKPVEARECEVDEDKTGGDVSGSGDGTGDGSGGVDQFGGTGGETGGSGTGVGQATGIFGQVASNWYWIVAALALIGLLVLAGWKGPAIAKFIKGKSAAKLAADEKAMRSKLRGKGLIK